MLELGVSSEGLAHGADVEAATRVGIITTSGLFDLSESKVLISGASRGIGLAIARHMLLTGAEVAINGYDADETTRAAAALNGEFSVPADVPPRVTALPGDIADPAAARSLVADAIAAFGEPHAVVCNAGIDLIQPAIEYGSDQWDRILDVNLRGGFFVAQAAARQWIDRHQRDRSITFTSSIAGAVGIATLAPYAASKGGINQLVRTLAVEWAPHGIRVNAVAPGYVQNIMAGVTAHDDPASEERIVRFTPPGPTGYRRRDCCAVCVPGHGCGVLHHRSHPPVDGGYTAN